MGLQSTIGPTIALTMSVAQREMMFELPGSASEQASPVIDRSQRTNLLAGQIKLQGATQWSPYTSR